MTLVMFMWMCLLTLSNGLIMAFVSYTCDKTYIQAAFLGALTPWIAYCGLLIFGVIPWVS